MNSIKNRETRMKAIISASSMILLCMLLYAPGFLYAQNVAVNSDGSLPNPNAMLDIKSSNKGLLIPRMSTEARLRIPNTQGLLVYDINSNSFWYNTGRQWRNLSPAETLSASGAWLLTGNAGTTDVTNFLGTTDNVPLNIRVNNQQSGRIDHLKGNTFWGFRSGFSITSGNDNTGIGASALFGITTGFNNTAVGSNALQSNSTGYHNTAVGRFALISNTTGFNNTAVGAGALFSNTTGFYNQAFGTNALHDNTTGLVNLAVGMESLYSNTTGQGNTALGVSTLFSNTTGFSNTGLASGTLQNNTTGSANTAVGASALYSNTTGMQNTATGLAALVSSTTADHNTANGSFCLFWNTTGSYNTANGSASMIENLTGSYNTATGYSSLINNTTGDFNTSFGYNALAGNYTGHGNTAVGAHATTASSNLTNATAIGYQAVVTASNKVRIGNAAVTVIEGQVPFTFPSDGRFKFGVQEDVKGLDFILQLRPVTYHFDTKGFDAQLSEKNVNDPSMDPAYAAASGIRRSGFIAQEVEQAAVKSGYNFSGVITPNKEQQYYSLSYDAFVVPLVKAVQEQNQVIESLKKQLAAKQQIDEARDKKLNDLENEIAELKKIMRNFK